MKWMFVLILKIEIDVVIHARILILELPCWYISFIKCLSTFFKVKTDLFDIKSPSNLFVLLKTKENIFCSISCNRTCANCSHNYTYNCKFKCVILSDHRISNTKMNFFLEPCFFLRCHPKASKCINRSLFKGQCICDSSTSGNGRTVCDGNSIIQFQFTAFIYSLILIQNVELNIRHPMHVLSVEQKLVHIVGHLLFLFVNDIKQLQI